MPEERNALAELAHTLCGVIVDNRHYATFGEYWNAEDAIIKSVRIIEELAKVEVVNGSNIVCNPGQAVGAVENCRAIAAEEGARNEACMR